MRFGQSSQLNNRERSIVVLDVSSKLGGLVQFESERAGGWAGGRAAKRGNNMKLWVAKSGNNI